MKDQFLALLKIMGDPEIIEVIADTNWKYFQAFKAKGFTDEQAMEIVKSVAASNKQ